MKNYNQYIKESNMTKLTQPSDEEIKDAEKILAEGKDPDSNMKDVGCFYIDVSGKYSVYYTFWRWNPKSANCYYICNLSTDFVTAVKKAAKASGRIPVVIDRFGTYAGLFQAEKNKILSFGKYRGQTIGEIFVTDPQYIVYLSKDFHGNAEMAKEIQDYKNLFFETLTKKNQEESTSKYIGEVGTKITIKATVYNFNVNQSAFGPQYTAKLTDDDGNRYIAYNIGRTLRKNDVVYMTAKVKEHKEIVGIKFTSIYYCKITNVFNLDDDMAKFNL